MTVYFLPSMRGLCKTKKMPRPPMGRKTSSAIPPKLTDSRQPSSFHRNGVRRAVLLPFWGFFRKLGSVFPMLPSPSFHQPTALWEGGGTVLVPSSPFITVCSLSRFFAFVKRERKDFYDKERTRGFCRVSFGRKALFKAD